MTDKKYIVKLLHALAIYFLLSEILKQILLYREFGHFDVWYFPYQLCSMPLYDLPIYMFLKKRNQEQRKIFSTFLLAYGALGGLIVFLDTSGLHFHDPILTFISYLWHIMMVVLSVLMFLYDDIDLSRKGYLKVCGLYLFHAAIATILNVTLRSYGTINMFYISPYEKMNQIVFKEIGKTIGNPSVITLYIICSLIGGGIIMHLYHLLKEKKNAETF